MEANMVAVSYEILEENEGNLSHDNALEHYLSPYVIKVPDSRKTTKFYTICGITIFVPEPLF